MEESNMTPLNLRRIHKLAAWAAIMTATAGAGLALWAFTVVARQWIEWWGG